MPISRRKAMAKARRTSDAGNIRIFRSKSGSRLLNLDDIGFGDEGQLHKLIESNIGTLFPGLTFLKREFRELDGGRHILDTVAFDKNQNTFVAIEYKNKLDREVIDQARSYLRRMRENKSALVLAYVQADSAGMLDPKSYNWDVYAIIMAPEFSKYQKGSAEEGTSLELHEIKRYDADILTVRRVGGRHTGVPPEEPKPESKEFHQYLSDKTRQLFGYVDGKLRDRFALERGLRKHQANYSLGSGRNILWIFAGKTQLKLWYAPIGENLPDALNGALGSSNTVPDSGFFKSKIKTEQDFEQIVPLIEHVIRHAQGLQ